MQAYSEYKDSGVEWLGEIPVGWELKALRRLVQEHSGYGFPIELQGDKNGTVPFLKVSDFSSITRMIDSSNNFVSNKTIKLKKWKKVPAGSLVTAKIGEALRKNHRNILGVDVIIDNNCIAFESLELDSLFCFYLHRIIDFDWFVNPGAVPSISIQKYKSLKVPTPPLPEQTAIAHFLDNKVGKIERLLAIKQQQIDLLKERQQILIQNAVTQGLNPNVPKKDSGIDWIGEIPAHWEVKPAKHLFIEVDERSIDGNEELLSVSHMTGVTPRSQKNVNMFLAEDYSGSKLCKNGDLIFNIMWAWMGALGVSYQKGIISPSYAVFRQKKLQVFNPFYLEMLLRSTGYIEHYNKVSTGLHSSRLRFYSHMFLSMKLGYPTLEEQKLIVNFIANNSKKINTAIQIKQQQIEKLKEYKTTLINAAVTGKIKVPLVKQVA